MEQFPQICPTWVRSLAQQPFSLSGRLVLLLLVSFGLELVALGQMPGESSANKTGASESAAATDGSNAADVAEIWICLVGGRRIQVDEITERAEGFWYKRGIVSTFLERARVERIERNIGIRPPEEAVSTPGSRSWDTSEFARVENFFKTTFDRPLPLTAFGQSDLHTRWRLDHRKGVDVGLHPDSTQGMALIKFLRSEGIPFLSFRTALPGVATGPHIHIGYPSHRLPAR